MVLVSFPKGIIIGNGQNFARTLENSLARLMFTHANALRDFPIVFDAAKEGVILDGGDVIVRDEKTLFLGVGQRSDRKAAPLLAQKLGMDVIAVSMPPALPSPQDTVDTEGLMPPKDERKLKIRKFMAVLLPAPSRP